MPGQYPSPGSGSSQSQSQSQPQPGPSSSRPIDLTNRSISRPSSPVTLPTSNHATGISARRSSWTSPSRGRSRSPVPYALGQSPPPSPPLSSRSPVSGIRSPPSYARQHLDRTPSPNPMILPSRPKVPPPIYLRSSSPQGVSSSGQLKIHIPAWGICLVKPPQELELHPLEDGSQAREPPTEDTVLSGSLEIIMKERRRCQAISVGVQSVCKLWMGAQRGWEEDGVFERGVEVMGGDADGIWLEKGSQTFTFTLLLPATLATYDHHEYARLSYIITARAEGIGSATHFGALFKRDHSPSMADIPFREDFDHVIARSDKIAQEIAHDSGKSSGSSASAILPSRGTASPRGSPKSPSPPTNALHLTNPFAFDETASSPPEDSAIAIGDSPPTVTGLYHRSQSTDIQRTTSASADTRSIISVRSTGSDSGQKTEKQGWLKGDLLASRALVVHANIGPAGGVSTLDLRKEGFVEGLGSWRFSLSSDSFSISAMLIFGLNFGCPAPDTTIFFLRLILVQSYSLISPRTPNEEALSPESPKNFVLYTVGKPHRSGERFPGYEQEALWRGPQARGDGVFDGTPSSPPASAVPSAGPSRARGSTSPSNSMDESEGWKIRAVARMPNHDKIRPSTHNGTITPIRVKHEMLLQVFYSVDRESVAGMHRDGPGELRMMSYKLPISVPSCTCTVAALNLPTYSSDTRAEDQLDLDATLSSPLTSKKCMCGASFAELGEAAMRKMHAQEQEEVEARLRSLTVGGGEGAEGGVTMSREGSAKDLEGRGQAS